MALVKGKLLKSIPGFKKNTTVNLFESTMLENGTKVHWIYTYDIDHRVMIPIEYFKLTHIEGIHV